ncbi:DUF1667 domain-containing protein [Treponema sp. OttesenSCG-928-L16]|nr:DUF1667 domain-containing protein [Treponema sp. OttesenSCG-928-L16]
MKEIICIVCPKGCRLKVDENNNYAVTGNSCDRGVAYGQKELTNPTRVITSTVIIEGAPVSRLPVKTDRDIPKKDIFSAMALLDGLSVKAPVRAGDIIVKDILGTGANFVATRTLEKSG